MAARHRHPQRGAPRTVAVLAVVVVGLAASACAGSGPDTTGAADAGTATREAPVTVPPTDLVSGRPHAVTTSTVTLVDGSRPTPAGAGGPAEPSRTIDVWLTLPDGEGPAPLVVFSHGMAGHPRKFEQLARAWAAAGYAVAAPAFPRSNADVPGSFSNLYDVPSQPGDVSFVLDQLLARSADPSSPLAGRFDPTRLAAAGLSAGGWTTYRVAVDPATRVPRFRAAIAFSAPDGLFGAATGAGAGVPVMVLHGDADPIVAPAGVTEGYEALDGPKYLVTILGGGHAGPFEDPEDALELHRSDWTELVDAVTVDFWDRYLLDDPAAEPRLVSTAEASDLVAFSHRPG